MVPTSCRAAPAAIAFRTQKMTIIYKIKRKNKPTTTTQRLSPQFELSSARKDSSVQASMENQYGLIFIFFLLKKILGMTVLGSTVKNN